MKLLTLFVHSAVKDDVGDALRALPQVSGFTVTRCEGHSTGSEHDALTSVRDRVVGYVPRARFDLALDDEVVEAVLTAVRACAGKSRGMGTWLVAPLDDAGRL